MTKLSKFIAQSGYCSRRKSTELIKTGAVTVNGTLMTEPYYEVQPKDSIKINNKLLLSQENKLYFLFNKPKNVICTMDDPQKRLSVADFFSKYKERLYPIGRLDRNTTGVLIVTNDGDLTQKLAHPQYNIAKTYAVKTHKPITPEHVQLLLQGVHLEDGFIKADKIHVPKRKNDTIFITIHSGKKHIIKRLFKHLSYFVEKLDRTQFAHLTKQSIPQGTFRALTAQEIEKLKNLTKS